MDFDRDVALAGVTPVDFETVRSPRRRRTIQLSVTPEGAVRVAAPVWTPHAEIAAFVARRAGWIERQRARINAASDRRLKFVSGEVVPFFGQPLELHVEPGPRRRATARRDGSRLHIELPAAPPDETSAEVASTALRAWLTRQSAAYLDTHVDWWAAAVGRQPAAVLVRNQRARWGSCAPDGTLRFNWRLAMFEPGIFDYVIVHELAHLLVDNHSPAFWSQVERVLPDHRERKAALRRAAAALPL
ncbi:MAG: M48 family metallopeptidase [Dehalococcoidia bacterium]